MRINEEKLKEIISSKIDRELKIEKIERLSGGAAQETYHIECIKGQDTRSLAFRRRAGGKYKDINNDGPGLRGEAFLMRCAKEVGVPTPQIYYVLSQDDGLGDGFIMEWVEGESLGRKILRDQQYSTIRPKLAYECGRLAARIHSIDVFKTDLKEILPTLSPKDYVQQTWSRYKSFGAPQPTIDYVGCWLMNNLPKYHRSTLVHNEFRNGNFLISTDGIVAVLDWEIAHIGDPMRDLGWLCTNTWRYGENLPVGGFGSYEQLFQGYEDESGISVDLTEVRFWEIFGAFWWSVTCLEMAQEARQGIDASIERVAIGRRSTEGQVDCINLLCPGLVSISKVNHQQNNPEVSQVTELLKEVGVFLRHDVTQTTSGRTQFLSRVSANAVDIVLRDIMNVKAYRKIEQDSLRRLLSVENESLEQLRLRLVESLRKETYQLDDEALQAHLRQTTVNQIAIDNPNYSGLSQALKHS